jgi:hypothetical protein
MQNSALLTRCENTVTLLASKKPRVRFIKKKLAQSKGIELQAFNMMSAQVYESLPKDDVESGKAVPAEEVVVALAEDDACPCRRYRRGKKIVVLLALLSAFAFAHHRMGCHRHEQEGSSVTSYFRGSNKDHHVSIVPALL